MAFSWHRYGRERFPRVTAGEVFIALVRDDWAKTLLGEIYRKLFEGEGVRQGTSPDHFIYVTPSKARSEINELASWVDGRFGPPGACVPAKTPFGYISGKWDGWLTLFADMASGKDDKIVQDFEASAASLPWAGTGTSRMTSTTAGEAPAAVPAPPAPVAASAATEEYPFWNEEASAASPPPPPPPPSAAAAPSGRYATWWPREKIEKPSLWDRFWGRKPAGSAPPPPAAPPKPSPEEEKARFEQLLKQHREEQAAEAEELARQVREEEERKVLEEQAIREAVEVPDVEEAPRSMAVPNKERRRSRK